MMILKKRKKAKEPPNLEKPTVRHFIYLVSGTY